MPHVQQATDGRFAFCWHLTGGFDLGLERTGGFETVWQCEIDPYATKVLEKHWPDVRRWRDVRTFPPEPIKDWRVDLICGGDPCPKHGNATRGQKSIHPDLSGYFLALVGRLRPRWVVRENVPAPTVTDFDAALDALGYGTVIVRVDAAPFTAHRRIREFVIGHCGADRNKLAEAFSDCEHAAGPNQARLALASVSACLTTNRTRHNTDENYIFEPGRGIRILDDRERESLAGFPEGWSDGLSSAAIARVCGNAVVPAVAQWIGKQIMEADHET